MLVATDRVASEAQKVLFFLRNPSGHFENTRRKDECRKEGGGV